MNYNNGLDAEEIEKLIQIPHLADVLDTKGYIRPTEESRILLWNSGIVPGFIVEDIARTLAWLFQGSALETHFKKPLKSGDNIGYYGWKGEPEIYIPGKIRMSILETSNVSGGSLRQFMLPEPYEYQDIIPTLLSDHLLQSWDFQLASGAKKIDSEWYFSGHYTIPKKHPFLTEKWFPFAFMKEVANQVLSLSVSLQENPNGIKNGSKIEVVNSHISKDWSSDRETLVEWGSTILITGKIEKDPEDPKRNVVAEYSAYFKSIPIFHGMIQINQSPNIILFR